MRHSLLRWELSDIDTEISSISTEISMKDYLNPNCGTVCLRTRRTRNIESGTCVHDIANSPQVGNKKNLKFSPPLCPTCSSVDFIFDHIQSGSVPM